MGCINDAQYCSRFKYSFNFCFILLGVNSEVRCVITSNVIDWSASCVTIHGIWNYVQVFFVGAGMTGSSSIFIG